MTTAVGRRNRTFSDALMPFTGLWADIAIIIAGSLVIAAFAPIKFSLPWTLYDRYDPRARRGTGPDGNP